MPQATPPQVREELPDGRVKAVEALYAAGHWLYGQQRIEDAVTVFRAVIRIAPHDERGWLALGACHEAQDRHDVALELYDEARRVASSAPRCGLARARIFRTRGMNEDANDAFAEAARIAEELDDEDLRVLVAAEGRRS
ncbi:MAG: tetratricopeptide repeat protein [Polyangiaceae bacterium]|jgi:tetratricopeptide (TPR) repeat protein